MKKQEDNTRSLRTTITDLCIEALQTDGAHHKQWYLEEILRALGWNVEQVRDEEDWEEGIAP